MSTSVPGNGHAYVTDSPEYLAWTRAAFMWRIFADLKTPRDAEMAVIVLRDRRQLRRLLEKYAGSRAMTDALSDAHARELVAFALEHRALIDDYSGLLRVQGGAA